MKKEQLKQIVEKSEFLKKLNEVIAIFEEAEELDVLDNDSSGKTEEDTDTEKTSLSEDQIKELIKGMDEDDRKTVEKAIELLKKASEKPDSSDEDKKDDSEKKDDTEETDKKDA